MGTNLKVLAVVFGTVLMYTLVARMIPQVESAVPEELTFTGAVTPEQLVAAGEELFNGAGTCTDCHGLGTRAPNLLSDHAGTGTIGTRCSTRVSGEDCKTYLHESLVSPTAYVVEGFEPIMPDMSRTLSGTQIWALVAYLESVGGEVTVTGDDIAAAEAEGGDSAGDGGAAAAFAGGSEDPADLIAAGGCTACHQLNGQGAPIGPPFDGMGGRITADRIRHSILLPNADTAQGYEQFVGTMPQTFGQQMTAAQLEALVNYLSSLR